MTRLQKALDAACDSPPATVAAGRLILERLGAESRALAAALAAASDGHEAQRWAAAFAAQCADICDDSRQPGPVDVGRGLGRAARAPPRVHRGPDAHRTGGPRRRAGRARTGADRGDQPPRGTDASTSPRWSGSSCSTAHATSCRSATTSPSGGATPASTTCSPPRRGSRPLSRSRRDTCPQESWFSLGRLLTTAAGEPVLLSWSGSMFEYLMPLLVMPGYDGTLLDQTCRAAVKRQIEYGRQRGVPWGISECGYNLLDARLDLPVPRVRRARTRPQARPRRRPGRRAVRVGARADGVARRGVREPAAPRGRGVRRGARLLRGDRLHAGARAARATRTPSSAPTWRTTRG